MTIVTFLHFSAVAALLWVLACFALSIPWLRRGPRCSVVIPATPEEVWPLLLPTGWGQFLQTRHWTEVELASSEPRTWTYCENLSMNRVAREVLKEPVYEEFRRLVHVVVARNGREIPERRRISSVWTLTPCENGTRVEIVGVGPSWTGIKILSLKLRQNDLLQAMRAHIVAQRAESGELRMNVRGWLWTPFLFVLLDLLARRLLSLQPKFSDILILFFMAGAILVREAGHAIAALAFGRKHFVVALSPLTGAATARARGFRSNYEAAIVSLAGPAFTAFIALSLTPALARATQLLRSFESATDVRFRLGLTLAAKLELASAGLVLVGFTLTALALIPIGSSPGSVIVRSVSPNLWARLSLTCVVAVAATCILPRVAPQDFLPLITSIAPFIVAFAPLGAGTKESGLAPLSRRNKASLLAIAAVVWAAFMLTKVNSEFLMGYNFGFRAGGEPVSVTKTSRGATSRGRAGRVPLRRSDLAPSFSIR